MCLNLSSTSFLTTNIMSRLDKTIVKFSGAKNYMDQLAQVTGYMNSIDETYYTKQISIVKTTYTSIINELSKYDGKVLVSFIAKLQSEYAVLDLDTLYVDIVKKAKKAGKSDKIQHKVRITPRDIYDSKWFKMIVELEKNAADLTGQFGIEGSKMTDAHKKIIQTEPIIVETHTFYGLKVVSDDMCKTIYITSKFINKLIEILLSPMYDVKAHMDKNWLPQIDQILGVELKSKMKERAKDIPVSHEDIKEYVYRFLLTKYRLEITGNTGEFVKTLMNSLDASVIGSANPARFINLMDGLKLDEIDDNKGVKKVVDIVKGELIKISENKDIKPADLLNDINEILSYGEKSEDDAEQKPEQEAEDVFA